MTGGRPDVVAFKLASVPVGTISGAARRKGHPAAREPAQLLREVDAGHVGLPGDMVAHRG